MIFVKDVMATQLITVTPLDTVKTARETLEKAHIRHLPVLTPEGGFVGLITQRDLFKAALSHFADIPGVVRDEIEGGIPVSEIMCKDVLTVPPNMPVSQAGEIMLTRKYGCLPVLDNGYLSGILTEADFVKLCLAFLEQSAS